MLFKIKYFSVMVILLIIMSIISTPTFCFSASKVKGDIIMATGGVGGNWYMAGAAMVSEIEKQNKGLKITVTPGGGAGNPTRLERGKADLGFSDNVLGTAAWKGAEPFKKPHKKLRAVVNFHSPLTFFFVITKDSKINSIKQIKQKKYPLRAFPGARGLGGEMTARRM